MEIPGPDCDLFLRAEDREGNELRENAQSDWPPSIARVVFTLAVRATGEVVARSTVQLQPWRNPKVSLNRAVDRMERIAADMGLWL